MKVKNMRGGEKEKGQKRREKQWSKESAGLGDEK